MNVRRSMTAVLLAAGLSACQTPGAGFGPGSSGRDDAGLSAASADYRRTVGEGVLTGAALGAGIGTLIGAAQGGGDDMLRGALIGGAIGGLVGGAGGTAVAENKRRQISAETRLDSEIAEARAANAKLATLVSVARRLVAKRRAEAAALRGGGGAKLAERRALLAELGENRRVLDGSIARAEAQKARLQQVTAGSGGGEARVLVGEAASTGRAVGELRRERDALGRIEDGLR